MSLPPEILQETLREASHLARLLGDMVHETPYDDHPALLRVIEAGLLSGGKSVLSGAHVSIDYPARQDE